MWALVKSGSVDTVYLSKRAVIIDGISHPKEMFTLWTESERKAIGVYDVVIKSQPDHNFYDIGTSSYSYNADPDTVTEDFTVTEQNLTKLKATHIRSVQSEGMYLITPYDWLVTRYAWDNTKTIPSAVKTYTAAVRSHSNTICTAITDCSDLAAFKVVHAKIYDDDGAYKTGWPDDSNVEEYKR